MKKKVWYGLYLAIDIMIIVISFGIVAFFRNRTRQVLVDYTKPIIGISLAWAMAGFLGDKFSIRKKERVSFLWKSIIKCDIIAIAVIFATMVFFNRFQYSRYVTFGTIGLTIILEFIFLTLLYYSFRFHKEHPTFAKTRLVTKSKKLEEDGSNYELTKYNNSDQVPPSPLHLEKYYNVSSNHKTQTVKSDIKDRYLAKHTKVYDFVNQYLDLNHFAKTKTSVIDSYNLFNIENVESESQDLFINLHKINNFRRINKYFKQINHNLSKGGVYVGCLETKSQRRQRFIKNFTPILGNFMYFIDFILRRVFPKIVLLKGLYFAITKGKNRALSETEVLGRLYFCGFILLAKKDIDGIKYFIVIKKSLPASDQNPSYGPLIRLKRTGKNGKTIYINKLRTMHPYSEYLQDYVYQTCSLQDGGKFKDDFRVTSWGKVFRKLWLDELPQVINFIKGELNIVGVRALSNHYFNLYPEEVQELRVKVKPGLIPPFYADMPKTFDEIVASEKKYLLQKLKKPFRTDFKYFWLALWNILVKRERSN